MTPRRECEPTFIEKHGRDGDGNVEGEEGEEEEETHVWRKLVESV